jgi:hypothetical protein
MVSPSFRWCCPALSKFLHVLVWSAYRLATISPSVPLLSLDTLSFSFGPFPHYSHSCSYPCIILGLAEIAVYSLKHDSACFPSKSATVVTLPPECDARYGIIDGENDAVATTLHLFFVVMP